MWRPDTLIDVATAARTDEAIYGIVFSGFLDTFYTTPHRRQAMIDPEPPMIDDRRRDAFLGATAEHLARRWHLDIPRWTNDSRRFLHHPWFTTSIEALKPLLLAQSPLAFRRRMIFVEHEPLSRARMPREAQANFALPSSPDYEDARKESHDHQPGAGPRDDTRRAAP